MAQDRWYIPIVITSANNSFVVTEDPLNVPVTYTVTIAAGTYYSYHASGAFTTGSSLYYAIRTAIAGTAAANTYTFAPITPTSSTAQTNAGLRISSDAVIDFRVDFQDAAFTMDNRWFGFGTAATNKSSAADVVDSKYTVFSQWVSYSLTDGTASEKISHLEREIEESSDRTADAYQVEWNEDRVRPMVYELVPAAHVYESRQDALDSAAYYATAGLSATDNHNAFEQVWDAGSRLGDILVQYDDVTTLDPVNGSYSIIRFNDRSERESMKSIGTVTTRGGEFYTLSVECLVTGGNYDN